MNKYHVILASLLVATGGIVRGSEEKESTKSQDQFSMENLLDKSEDELNILLDTEKEYKERLVVALSSVSEEVEAAINHFDYIENKKYMSEIDKEKRETIKLIRQVNTNIEKIKAVLER